MKKSFQCFVVSLLLMPVFFCMLACKDSSKTSYITEDDIWHIMDEVEGATLDRDIDGIVRHLAPSVVIRVTAETPFGPQRVKKTREQYKADTLKLWSIMSHHEYRRENEEIKISDDGQVAIVEGDIIERHVVQGQTMDTTTHERVTLEIIDGNILVTKIDASIRPEQAF
jgi:ketosteroid isomerase-like protein